MMWWNVNNTTCLSSEKALWCCVSLAMKNAINISSTFLLRPQGAKEVLQNRQTNRRQGGFNNSRLTTHCYEKQGIFTHTYLKTNHSMWLPFAYTTPYTKWSTSPSIGPRSSRVSVNSRNLRVSLVTRNNWLITTGKRSRPMPALLRYRVCLSDISLPRLLRKLSHI